MRSRGIVYILIAVVLAAIVFGAIQLVLIPFIGAEKAAAFFSWAMWLFAWLLERLILWMIALLILAIALYLVITPALDLRRKKLRPFMFLGGLIILYVAWIALGEAWTSLLNTNVEPGG